MRAPLRLWFWTALFMPLFLSNNGDLVCNTWTTDVNKLNTAMEGYDPVMSNPLEIPDPGMRNQIFELVTPLEDGSAVLNSFVDKAREFFYCNSELTGKTFRNYQEYKAGKFLAHAFSHGADISARAGFGNFSFEASAGYGRKENSEESIIKKFFQETKGEIIENKVQCITHSVSIALFLKPVFTPAFLAGLRRLHVAAMNPLLKESKDEFTKFVSTYGTHYMGTTYLGSKLIFQKLFTSKLVDRASESERRKCVETSAYGSIGGSYSTLASASASFKTNSSKCDDSDTSNAYFQDNSMNSERIISMGSLPTTDFQEWVSTAKDSPVPIYYVLRKISSLFSSEWFNSIPLNEDNDSEMINGTAMHKFFEEYSSRYCALMLGSECPAEEKGCGINSDCTDGLQQCVEDPDSDLGYRCDIKYEPLRSLIRVKAASVPPRSNLSFTCEVLGDPVPEVIWHRDQDVLVPSDRIIITTGNPLHTLTVMDVTSADTGHYSCMAQNFHFSTSSSTDAGVEEIYVSPACVDNPFIANCELIVQAKYCNNVHYARFCCRSCTIGGQLPSHGPSQQQG